MLRSFNNYLLRPLPIYTLVWLRIAIGLLGAGDIIGNGIYYHWYKDAFSGFTFRYFGFEWVYPLPELLLSAYFVIGFLLGIAVAVGWRFRVTAPLFALFFTYLFLLEKAHYLNHAYLFCWLCWILALTPAWREWSLDVWRKPQAWSPVVPRWSLVIFPTLMGVVYFFGGVAKLNADWLLHASPLGDWISTRSSLPLVGPLLAKPTTAYFMAWGGFLLDTFIAFLLLHRRWRWWALGGAVFFHVTNHLIFNIGIFPYLSLVLTSLFFEPDWPRRFVDFLSGRNKVITAWRDGWQRFVRENRTPNARFPQYVNELKYQGNTPFFGITAVGSQPMGALKPAQQPIKWPVFGFLLLLGVHLGLPLRHHFFHSDVAWSEEGHRYSWRMMLRSKRGTGDFKVAVFRLGQPSDVSQEASPEAPDSVYTVYPRRVLSPRRARKLFTHPDMILQFAHYLAEECRAKGDSCAVYANVRVKLNNGKMYPFVDARVDLARREWEWLATKDWVLPEGVMIPPNPVN